MTFKYMANIQSIHMKLLSQNYLVPFDYLIILSCLILIPSAVAQGLLGVDEKYVFTVLAPSAVFVALISRKLKVSRVSVLLIWFIMITGVVGSFVSGAYSQLLMGGTLALSLLAGYVLLLTMQKPKALRILSIFTLTLLIGGIIGLLYALGGNSPLYVVKVGYRTTYLYLTTFSFANIGSYIRPSGIFDEPGAFAMYAAIITMFNDAMNQNRRLNIAIVVLIVFTGSLFGIFITVLYFLTSNSIKSNRAKTLMVITVLAASYAFAFTFIPDNQIIKTIDTFYSARLEITDGRLVGDNRSNQIEEFFYLINSDILSRGAKASPGFYKFDDQSSNPFSIIFGYGLIISIPYFALLLWLLYVTFRNRFYNCYASLGLFCMLLQRPYIYNMSWSIMIAAISWLIYASSQNYSQIPDKALTY